MKQKKQSKIIKELRQLIEIMSGKQREYYERILSDATPVRIAPLSEVFDEETIRMIKEVINPQPKECYRNATMLCEMFKGIISYVEGRYTVMCTFSTEHAWNKIEDKYIDITAELVLGHTNPNEEEYVALGEYDDNEVLSYCMKSKVYGGIYQQKFLENYGKDLSNKR